MSPHFFSKTVLYQLKKVLKLFIKFKKQANMPNIRWIFFQIAL